MKTSISLFVTLAFVLAVFAARPQCDRYICTGLQETQCARMDLNDTIATFHLNPCNNSQICPIHFAEEPDICQDEAILPTKYPGEYCKNDTECFKGFCNTTKKACQGAAMNEKCEIDEDCDTGLYCSLEGLCVKAKEENEPCGAHEKCAAPFACNLGNCTKIGSLKVGKPASAPAACETYYISDGKCQTGAKLIRSEEDPSSGPIDCPEKTDVCKYKIEGKEEPVETNCECGMNEKGVSYCNPGKGELDIKPYVNYVSKQKSDKCHVSRGPLCLHKPLAEMGIEYYRALEAHVQLGNWALVYENPSCVKATLNSDYWFAVQQVEEDDEQESFGLYLFIGVAIATIVIAAIVVFFLFKCKTGENEDEEDDKRASLDST